MDNLAGKIPDLDALRSAYIANSDFIEHRYEVPSLDQILTLDGVLGASRLIVLTSFSSEELKTFVYFRDRIEISVAIGATSLWGSLSGFQWINEPDPDGFGYVPFIAAHVERRSRTLPLSTAEIPATVASWNALIGASSAAPACMTSMCDGISYHHRVRGPGVAIDAFWSNPDSKEHPAQIRLLGGYYELFQLADLFSEERGAKRHQTRRSP